MSARPTKPTKGDDDGGLLENQGLLIASSLALFRFSLLHNRAHPLPGQRPKYRTLRAGGRREPLNAPALSTREKEKERAAEESLVGCDGSCLRKSGPFHRSRARVSHRWISLSTPRMRASQLALRSQRKKRAKCSSPGLEIAACSKGKHYRRRGCVVGCISNTRRKHSPRRQRHGPRHGRARRSRGADDGLAGLDDGAGIERLKFDADGLRRGPGGSGDGRGDGGASRDRWPRNGGRSLRDGDDGSHFEVVVRLF